MRVGFSTLAVSAMNQTPQNAITSPRELARLARELEAVADHVGKFLNLRFLVMMRQQNRTALLLQFQNLIGDGSS